jgi:hypothetical protein
MEEWNDGEREWRVTKQVCINAGCPKKKDYHENTKY